MANESWIYQGRQAHGWFGSGTAPKDVTTETPGGVIPSSLADRVRWVAHGAVAEMPREQRARSSAQLAHGALKSLIEAMPAWIRSAGLDAESFREHFFPHASARAAAQLQAVAAAIGYGDDLGPAMAAFAEAVQAMGLDNAPRVLAAAAEQAANLVPQYNPSLPTYHGYEFYEVLGRLGENGLTVESAYNALLQTRCLVANIRDR